MTNILTIFFLSTLSMLMDLFQGGGGPQQQLEEKHVHGSKCHLLAEAGP